jgi:hypothetical protein
MPWLDEFNLDRLQVIVEVGILASVSFAWDNISICWNPVLPVSWRIGG